jgi:hypothetical protein
MAKVISNEKSEDEFEGGSRRIGFGIINVLGLIVYIPLLFILIMSFDAPGSGKHWAHWYFVFANILLGPLCLTALLSRKTRHWGLIGYAIAFSGWLMIMIVCAGEFC